MLIENVCDPQEGQNTGLSSIPPDSMGQKAEWALDWEKTIKKQGNMIFEIVKLNENKHKISYNYARQIYFTNALFDLIIEWINIIVHEKD